MRDLISWILESTEGLLRALGLPESWRDEILPALLVSGLGALALLLWRGIHSLRLQRRKELPSSQVDLETERAYLSWLQTRVKNVASFWQRQEPPRPVTPVPLAAKKLKLRLFDRLRLRARSAYLQVRLFRYNVKDYSRNPTLGDLELSVRAGFGRRVKIRHLARELRKFRVIIVLGDPGSGKSVCLRQLAWDLATEALRNEDIPRTIPIFLEMGGYDGWEDHNHRQPQAVLEFIRQSLLGEPSIREAPEDHPLLYVANRLEDLLRQGRITCIFDALDEMPQDSYPERYKKLRGFIEAWGSFGNRFVFSCRSLDYDQSFAVDEVIIDPFDRPRIRAFLELNVPAMADALYRRITEDETLEEMVANPFFLQALAFINQPSAQAGREPRIPTTRGQLVREFAEALLERETGTKQSDRLEDIPDGPARLRIFLSELAFAFQTRREGGTSVRTEDLADLWARYPDWPALLRIASRARILGKRGTDTEPGPGGPPARIEFVHHRLAELFAAQELARRFRQGWPLEQYLENLWWQETVILAIGLLKDPAPVLQRVLAHQLDVDEWIAQVAEQAGQAPEAEWDKSTAGVLEEIQWEYGKWREQLLDLALVVRMLDRIRMLLPRVRADLPAMEAWGVLKRRGEALSRRRALFIAAEAVGHIPVEKLAEERSQLRRNLDVLIRDGNSLQQVRALRALRFIPSREILPALEYSLHERSSWVKATALRVLFRLDLREQRARAVLRRMLWRSFGAAIALPFAFFRDGPQPGNIFSLRRGLLSGLRKERGGLRLLALVLVLWTVAASWLMIMIIPVSVCGIVAGLLLAAGVVIGLPVLLRFRRQPLLSSVLVPAALDYVAIVLLLYAAPKHLSAWIIGAFAFSLFPAYGIWPPGGPREKWLEQDYAELGSGVARTALLAIAALHLPLGSGLMLLGGAIAAQFTWILLRFLRETASPTALLGRMLLILGLFALGFLADSVTLKGFPSEEETIIEILRVALVVLLSLMPLRLGLRFVRFLRVQILSRSHNRFSSLTEYLTYILDQTRNSDLPLWARTRTVLYLQDVPSADPALIARLMDFAETDLPPSVRDAVFQVIDAAEKRIHRGQTGLPIGSDLPMSAISEPSVGVLLRSYISLVLVGAVLAALGALLAALRLLPSLTAYVAVFELGAGAALLVVSLLTLGKRSIYRLLALVGGAGLVGMGISNLFLPEDLAFAARIINLTLLPIALGFAGVLAGCIVYFLDSDDAPSKLREIPVAALTGLPIVVLAGMLLHATVVQEQLACYRDFLPRFIAVAPGRTAVESIFWDGRGLRVSLMKKENFRDLMIWPFKESTAWRRDPGALSEHGEVWISGETGIPNVRSLLPGGCLAVIMVERGRVVLGTRPECNRQRWKLLARVYGPEQSTKIRHYLDVYEAAPGLKPHFAHLLAGKPASSLEMIWSPPL